MINAINKVQILKQSVTIMFVLLICVGVVFSNINNVEKSDVIQFDTIFELNAPYSGTPVLLFARYWVSKDFYSIGFQWAEPQVGNINFPTYPGVTINSNQKEFSITSQIIESHNQTYPKPIEDRGVFRHALGSYHFKDIRFAEPEAITSRIYKKDMANISKTNNQVQTVNIADSNDNQTKIRLVNKLEIKQNNGNIENLKAFDTNGALLKDINYKYVTTDGISLLKHQNILLPEKRIWVGFNDTEVTLTIRGQKKTYKEFPGFHHTGGRKFDIEYETIKTDKGLLTVPSSIIAKRADADYTLRTAKMSNFTQLKLTWEETQKQALEFSRMSEKELEVRNLFEKYWLKNPNDINEIDTKRLDQLRGDFIRRKSEFSKAPENLKNVSMLLDLDWIQNDPNLHKDFKQYMNILRQNDFKEMILLGGLNAIDMTARWGKYSDADKLFDEWIVNVIPLCNPMDILNFSDIHINKKKYWITIKLLENYLEKKNDLGEERFDILAMKYMALLEINKLIDDPSKIEQDSIRSQAEWVLKSTSKEDLIKLATDSLEEANKTYAELKEPNKTQISIKEKINKTKVK